MCYKNAKCIQDMKKIKCPLYIQNNYFIVKVFCLLGVFCCLVVVGFLWVWFFFLSPPQILRGRVTPDVCLEI